MVRLSGWVFSTGIDPVRLVVFEVHGFALDYFRPYIGRVDAREYGQQLGIQDPPAVCGFSTELDFSLLPARFTLQVRIAVGEAETLLFYSLDIEQDIIALDPPLLKPLAVTTLGRTGSTWLIRLLGTHPEIVSSSQAETRICSYWANVARALAQPKSYLRKLDPLDLADRSWWMGGNYLEPAARRASPEIEKLIGQDCTQRLLRVAADDIQRYYCHLGHLAGKNACFFAEKFLPNFVPDGISQILPGGKEIFLVRNWLDMLASILSYSEKRGSSHFGLSTANDLYRYIASQKRSVRMLRESWQRRRAHAVLLRYEDLVLDPQIELARIFKELGVKAAPEVITQCLKSVENDSALSDSHRSAASPELSINRWKRDLSPGIQAFALEVFSEELRYFEYES